MNVVNFVLSELKEKFGYEDIKFTDKINKYDAVEFLLNVEERFNVCVPDDRLVDINTVQDLIHAVKDIIR